MRGDTADRDRQRGERQRDHGAAAEEDAQAQPRAIVQRTDTERGDPVAELVAGDEIAR